MLLRQLAACARACSQPALHARRVLSVPAHERAFASAPPSVARPHRLAEKASTLLHVSGLSVTVTPAELQEAFPGATVHMPTMSSRPEHTRPFAHVRFDSPAAAAAVLDAHTAGTAPIIVRGERVGLAFSTRAGFREVDLDPCKVVINGTPSWMDEAAIHKVLPMAPSAVMRLSKTNPLRAPWVVVFHTADVADMVVRAAAEHPIVVDGRALTLTPVSSRHAALHRPPGHIYLGRTLLVAHIPPATDAAQLDAALRAALPAVYARAAFDIHMFGWRGDLRAEVVFRDNFGARALLRSIEMMGSPKLDGQKLDVRAPWSSLFQDEFPWTAGHADEDMHADDMPGLGNGNELAGTGRRPSDERAKGMNSIFFPALTTGTTMHELSAVVRQALGDTDPPAVFNIRMQNVSDKTEVTTFAHINFDNAATAARVERALNSGKPSTRGKRLPIARRNPCPRLPWKAYFNMRRDVDLDNFDAIEPPGGESHWGDVDAAHSVAAPTTPGLVSAAQHGAASEQAPPTAQSSAKVRTGSFL